MEKFSFKLAEIGLTEFNLGEIGAIEFKLPFLETGSFK